MPVARTHSIALVGVEGYPVEVESDIENGLPCLLLVGLPDTALREARDRIRAAIINSHEQWPQRRITVGLSPASLPKRGSGFDLGIALSILAAAGAVPPAAIDGVVFLGELGLDGRVRPVRGVLPAMAAAGCAGFGRAVVAQPNAEEAALVPGSGLPGRQPWPACSPGCAVSWRRKTLAWFACPTGTSRRTGRRCPAVHRLAPDGKAVGHRRPPASLGRRVPSRPGRRVPSRPGRRVPSGPGRWVLSGPGRWVPSRPGHRDPGPTFPRCSASPPLAGRQRSAPPAVIICRCSARRARARPCWPNGCPPSCPRWTR